MLSSPIRCMAVGSTDHCIRLALLQRAIQRRFRLLTPALDLVERQAKFARAILGCLARSSRTRLSVDTISATTDIQEHGSLGRVSLRQHTCSSSSFEATGRQRAPCMHLLILP